ncbi:MAG: quinone oxidoreductase [Myxococcales bacterium]|nr:quinone oxidoreductase [Myxococcales bacterium]
MTRAVRIHEHGGPEVLRVERVEVGEPGVGEARVRHVAVGLNFIDTYHRSGCYPLALPSGLGTEAAGVVEALGPDVTGFAVGDRVATASGPLGACSEARVVPVDRLVPLPDDVDARTAAAMMLKGLTAHYLLLRTRALAPGTTVLFHAAAGGVGLIFCQWAAALGVRVIGTVSTAAKAELARANGCAQTILPGEDLVARVRELTGGAGVEVAFDAVGRDTIVRSLDCIAPLGLLVSFGQASGPVPPLELLELTRRGSLFVTRPSLATHVGRREALLGAAAALFAVVRQGAVKVTVGQTFPLAEVEAAHRALEARATVGSTLLLP